MKRERQHSGAGTYRDSYNVAVAPISKTYAPGGASAPDRCGRPFAGSARIGAQEHLMLDIVMLALGLGFFAAAVGYTYACERL